jgi:enoyl-CoA hydratase/carnithine racemase
MLGETELSALEPFLSVKRLEWADLVRFGDDVFGIAEAPNAIESFRRLLRELAHHPGKALVFCGTSRCFSPERCSALLRQLGDMQKPLEGRRVFTSPLAGFAMAREENVFGGLIRWLRSVRRPVIMVFQGDVCLPFLGIGLACDFRIATSDTVFHNQGRELDMPPGVGLLYLLPAYVGLGRASNLVTRIARMSAQTALEWGLLDEVIAPSELDAAIQRMGAEVSCYGEETLNTIKQMLNHSLPSFDDFFTMETHGLDKALRGKPWEKLADEESPGVSS